MTKNTHRFVATAIAAVLAGSAPFSMANDTEAAAAASETDAVVSQVAPEQVQVQRNRLFSAAARTAVEYMSAAGQALASDDTDQAGALLDGARGIVERLQEATDKTADVPVLARVGLVDDSELDDATAMLVNAKVADLEPLVLSGQHAAVAEGLKGFGVALSYEYMSLPLGITAGHLDDAIAALTDGRGADAGTAIAAAFDDLIGETVTVGAVVDEATASSAG